MPYRFRLEPNDASQLTLDDYAARFLAAGLEPTGLQDSNIRRFSLRNHGVVVVTYAMIEGELYAEAQIGLTSLCWDADEIRPRVEVWLRIAAQTDSLIFDGYTREALVDEASITACVDRVVVKRHACFKGGKTWVIRRHFL